MRSSPWLALGLVLGCSHAGDARSQAVERVTVVVGPIDGEPLQSRTVSLEVPVGATVDGPDSGRMIYVRDAKGTTTLVGGVYLDPGRHAAGVDLPCAHRHPDSVDDFAICAAPQGGFHVVGYSAAADISCGGGTVPLPNAHDIVRLCRSLRTER
jgi:hypothetical protein